MAIHPFLQGYGVSAHAGGKNKAALRLTQYLATRGDDVYIFPWYEQNAETVVVDLHVGAATATLLPTVEWRGGFRRRRSLRRVLGKVCRCRGEAREGAAEGREEALKSAMEVARPDVVHLHYGGSDFPRVFRSLGFRAPLVLTCTHKRPPCPQYCDAVGFFSRFMRDEIVDQVAGWPPTLLAYPGIDEEYRGDIARYRRNGFVCICSLKDTRKGVGLLIDTYESNPSLNQWPLQVIGEGPLRESLRRRCAALDLNIHFAGRLSNTDTARELQKSSVFVLPSVNESFGIVYAEALAMGLPIIGFPPSVNELGEVTEMDVGVGFSADRESRESLADAMHGLISEQGPFTDGVRREMALRARQRFDWRAYGTAYREVYEKLVRDRI